MSVPRYRHKFTLANRQLRPPVDPFERDPFKIHSYNFRYADRPSFCLSSSQQQVTTNRGPLNECETFFYNNGFSNMNNLNAARVAVDRRISNLKKFQEYRRRFLNRSASYRNCNPPQAKGNPSSFNNGTGTSQMSPHRKCSKDNIRTSESFVLQKTRYSTLSSLANLSNSLSRNTTQGCATSDMKPECSKRSMLSHTGTNAFPNKFSTSSATITKSQAKVNSGCEINIHIKGLDRNGSNENMNIKIEPHSIYKDLNIPTSQSRTLSSHKSNSSNNFISNKTLSKFSSIVSKRSEANKSERERIKQLTAIYSSPKFAKSSRTVQSKSSGRFPSLMPCQTYGCNRDGSSSFKLDRPSQPQRVNGSSSVYDNKAGGRNWSQYSLKHKLRNVNLRDTKQFAKFSLSKGNNSKMRTNDRSPLNININVFADNLKLLKM